MQPRSSNLRIDPDFRRPEPSAAEFHAYFTLDEFSHQASRATLKRWNAAGVRFFRLTLVNDEYPKPPYPDGYWLEGWTDPRAVPIPFGGTDPRDGTVSPPLTKDPTHDR